MDPQKMDLQKKIGLISSIIGIIALIVDLLKKISENLHLPEIPIRIILLAPTIFFLVPLLKKKILQPSRLVKPELLPTDVESEAQLIGRKYDLDNLLSLCRQTREIHIVGESGVGKSVLLRIGLFQVLKESGAFHPVYIESWGNDWDQGPRGGLAIALWQSFSAEERVKLGIASQPSTRQVVAILKRLKHELTRIPLLIFDQFDDYIVRHRSKFLSNEHRAWLPASELVAVNTFWKDIARLLEQDCVRLLVVTRTGEADGLHSVRFGSPEVFRLERLDADFIRPLLAKITDDGVASNPARGWTLLQERLIADLGQDGWILPVQMSVVLQGLSTLSTLTTAAYNDIGGCRGIEAALIEKHLVAASRLTGLASAALLQILLEMIDNDSGKTLPVSLDKTSPPESQAKILIGMEYLLGVSLIARQFDPDTGESLYSLYHDYLCRGVKEVERRANRWRAYLRDHYRTFERAKGSLWRQWWALLSPATLITIMVQRARGRASLKEMRHYILLSAARFIPFLVVPVIVLSAADQGFNFPGANTIRDSLDEYHLSISRPYHPLSEIKLKAQQQRRELEGLILARRDSRGWIRSPQDRGLSRDYWSQGQALCALLNSPETIAVRNSLVTSNLSKLFDPLAEVKVNHAAYGWLPYDGEDYTRAEPTLWTQCAVSLAAETLRRSGQNKADISNWQRFVDDAMKTYKPSSSGSWNVFPNQIDIQQGSTYITALALLALLKKHEAADFTHNWSDDDREELRSAVRWLIAHYEWNFNPPGWKDGTGFQVVSQGLTFQIYSTLLQTEEEEGIEIPRMMLRNIEGSLRTATLVDFRDSNKTRYKITFVNHAGLLKSNEQLVEFLAYPWSISCSARWIRRERSHHQRVDPLIQRFLSVLVLDFGNRAIQDARGDFTFKASELLYALDSVEDM